MLIAALISKHQPTIYCGRVAEDLGVISVDRAAGGELKYIDDLFMDLTYNEEKKNPQGYHGFIIPRLKRPQSPRAEG